VPFPSRHSLIAVLAVLASLLVGAPAAATAQGSAHASASKVRLGVDSARDLGRGDRCARRLFSSRAKRMTPRQRQRAARRVRDCRRARQSTVSSGPLYWGAWIGSQLTGDEAPWDMNAVSNFERMAGKGLSVINFSAPFANCSSKCSYYDFPAAEFDRIRGHGSIPFYSWGSQSIPAPYGASQPNFQLSDVLSGSHDAYIRQFAEDARDWGKPFFLRFNWEMNGGWFNWSEGVNGNQKGEYVTAWRHVHDIFTEVGATNATWVWCPNVDPTGKMQDLASLYPGDEYVDWTGLDGYNWGTNPARPDRWRSFDELYRSTYDLITETIAPSKPLIVSEVGSTEYGGSKADWIEDMLATVPASYPKIRGLLWFEKYDDGMDWPIETSNGSASAFASGIQDPTYVSNQFGSLSASSISPVS
jgi:mannan endo-1,4-beta-mannosidase